tara:strand:- start:534 stop:1085 length:552 start_codon:yes stop_codon:yes gene_type:complete
MKILKKLIQSISIRQIIITGIIIITCTFLSIKNTSQSLYRLHESSFEEISSFIDRKAFLLDQFNQLIISSPPLSLRQTFKYTQFPQAQLLVLEKLNSYESQFNKKIKTQPQSLQKKAAPIQHALLSNEKQLQIQLAIYNANATEFNQLHTKKLYSLFFQLFPYPKIPQVNIKLLSINTLIVKK